MGNVYNVQLFYSGQILKEVFSTCQKSTFTRKNIDAFEVISIIQEMGINVDYYPRYMLAPDLKDGFLFDMYIQHKAHCLITEEKRLLNVRSRLFSVNNIKWLKENFPH
ncbi:MAG: hypothetical protein MUF24_03475 [Chitinophagaceae bacterium]|nr:hypothetical protein [Chitinophagaceae bacterium]